MLHVIILAAGEGKRMRSAQPKVLQPVGGRAMLAHLLETVSGLEPDQVHIVIGQGAEAVQASLPDFTGRFAHQTERLGTGHATLQAMDEIPAGARVLVLPGDMPLVRVQTLQALLDERAPLSLLSFMANDPTGYGRILRDGQDRVTQIREQADATPQEAMVKEVNSGVLVGESAALKTWLEQLVPRNAQGEYYLTDVVGLAVGDGQHVSGVIADDANELMGANDRAQLALLEQVYQARCRRQLMADGAILEDPSTVYVKGRVQVGQDVVIGPQVTLQGNVTLGDGVVIGPGCVVSESHLAAGTEVKAHCVLEGIQTTGPCQLGPFARLRPGTELASGVKVGNFVEIKKSKLAEGAKVSHLSYIGDATLGQEVNVGAGTITCNYDGVNKHHTRIGDGAFIGSNSSLVAPVSIGECAVIGAGSVISKDAPADQLSLTRAPQRQIEGWTRPDKAKKKT